ncbi:MAG: FtsQ-type POTRA domain-containing protein [Gammaproteobacteria bacterium]|nr:FtsQ-type POTRA domain-containing protein [Gammaproteobacteria bacterium]
MLHNATPPDFRRRAIEHAPIAPLLHEKPTIYSAHQITARRHEPTLSPPAPETATPRRAAPLPPRRRSRLRVLLLGAGGVLLAALAGALVMKLLDPATLPIKSVRIEGRFTHVTAAELQQKLAGVAAGNFLSVNVEAIRHAAQTLPWVRTVTVRRVWPDTVRVEVTEQLAIAHWSETGAVNGTAPGTSLLNNSGALFTPERASFPNGLPEIRGPRGAHSALLAHYYAMNQALLPLKLRVTRLTQDERRAFHLQLDNGTELALGRADSYARLMRFVRAWPALQAREAQVALIDLRYSNGFAVRLKTVASD